MIKKFVNFFFEEEEVEATANVIAESKHEIQEHRKTVVKEEPLFYETARKPSTFIDFEDKNDVAMHITEKVKKEKIYQSEKPIYPDYVFTSVISPIFGIAEEETPKTKSPQKQSYSATPPMKDSLLGTIISPIYGKLDMNLMEKKRQESEAEAIFLAKKEVLPPMYSLEDVIGEHRKLSVVEDDSHQFSLFEGDEQSQQKVDNMEALGISEFFDAKSK